jgi:taurine dioxygenase
MRATFDVTMPLPGAGFGATVRLTKPLSQGIPEGLPAVLAKADGLMCIPGLQEIADQPELLVALSRAFGPEVEDYRYTLTQRS